MATHRPTLSVAIPEFLLALLSETVAAKRGNLVASRFAEFFPGAVIAIYRYDEQVAEWGLLAHVGASQPEEEVQPASLANVRTLRSPEVWAGSALRVEQFAHLGIRRSVASLACVPLIHNGRFVAAIEIASFDRKIDVSEFAALAEFIHCCAIGVDSAIAYETERNNDYDSITRLTQLYDLERTFNSTLDMEKLFHIVPAKIRDILPCTAIHLWMVQGEELILTGRAGDDHTLEPGAVLQSKQGIPGAVADQGKPIAVQEASDPRIVERVGQTGTQIRHILAVPVIAQGFLVGVIEAVDKQNGKPFTEDDLFFLTTISETAASALHNASLLEAERKVEILETLVEVSREITSTLNLERVLRTVVNGPQKIMEYDRAAIALESMGKLQIKAISGKNEVVVADPQVKALREVLQFCAVSESETYVLSRNGVIEADNDDTRSHFTQYFQQSGSRAWYCVPLADDQGRLGLLSFESKDPDFLTDAHFELIKVLAAQATVAVRNASMYTETPFLGVLQPLQKKKQQFLALGKRQRIARITLATATLLFLVFFPLPMRVAGTAVVAPERKAAIQAPFDGTVQRVLVREGDAIHRGEVLAELEDWEYRSAIANAEAKRDEALAKMNRALATNDGAEAGVQRVEADYWKSELGLARERLNASKLRSPIDGVISTPKIEDQTGRKLQLGDLFAEVVDTSHTSVDVQVDQTDVPLLQPGDTAAIKLESFPTRKFSGSVVIVSPVATVAGDERVFTARVDVHNPDGALRAGMQGSGKISTGWRSAGFVLFRGFGMWFWTKVWNWFGW